VKLLLLTVVSALVLAAVLPGCAARERRAEQIAYVAAECERSGYERDSREFRGCVSAHNPIQGSQYVPMQRTHGTRCYTMGRSVNCY